MKPKQRYPGITSLAEAARKRIPKFALDYFEGGIGTQMCLKRNRVTLDSVRLLPRYLIDNDYVDLRQTLLGENYDLPFGVAPIGLGGLIWPHSAEHLAAAAKRGNIPFTLSGFATTSIEKVMEIGGDRVWYQHYYTNDEKVENAILDRVKATGCKTLVVTIDIPTLTRREHDIKNGLSVPPRFDLHNLYHIAHCPTWAIQTLRAGIPKFQNYTPHIPVGLTLTQLGKLLSDLIEGHVTPAWLKTVRDRWQGNLIVKGVLDPRDAEDCRKIGVDALVVSNHGGRQLDAAPGATEVLADIRQAAGEYMPILADGGVRSGLDIVRLIASGADFVLSGRAFMYGVAALGSRGGDHVVEILKEELRSTMGHLGCPDVNSMPKFLYRD